MNLHSMAVTNYLQIISSVLSIFEVLFININISVMKRIGEGFWGVLLEDYGRAFWGFSISRLFEWYCLYQITLFALRYINNNSLCIRECLCIIFPGLLFSTSMIIGKSFQMGHSLEAVWGSKLQILKSLTAFSGYLLLFICLTICVFCLFDYLIIYIHSHHENWKGRFLFVKKLYDHPFVFVFCFMMIVGLPYIIIYYPGILLYDSMAQINQLIRIFTIDYSDLIWGKNIWLDNHHTVAHTVLLDSFVIIGKYMTGSFNIGLFLYTVFNMICVISAVSFIIKLLIEKLNFHSTVAVGCLSFYFIHPFVQQIIGVCTKDGIYSVLFLLFITFSFLRFKYKDKQYALIWFLCAAGLVLFRKEGVYIAVISMICQVPFLGDRKREYKYISWIICLFLGLNFILIPAFHVRRDSIREVLAIPFMQTARYIKYAENEVTCEEKQIISQILDYKKVREKYIGYGLADSVAKTYKRNSTLSDLKRYFIIWWEMLKKHPAIYLEAFLDFKYQYLYPSNELWREIPNQYSKDNMNWINEKAKTDFSHYQPMDSFRDYYFVFRRNIIHLPVIGMINSTAIYIWICFLCIIYCIKRKARSALVLWIPLFLHFLTMIAGFTNGNYARYMYVYILSLLPTIIYMMDLIYMEHRTE